MCTYCNELFTGNYGEDLSDVNVKINKISIFRLQTCINDEANGKVYLKNFLIDQFGQPLALGKIAIQYCPICGRKFKKES